MVIVPPEPEWEQRLERRREAEGDDVPESVMLEMKGGEKRGGKTRKTTRKTWKNPMGNEGKSQEKESMENGGKNVEFSPFLGFVEGVFSWKRRSENCGVFAFFWDSTARIFPRKMLEFSLF